MIDRRRGRGERGRGRWVGRGRGGRRGNGGDRGRKRGMQTPATDFARQEETF